MSFHPVRAAIVGVDKRAASLVTGIARHKKDDEIRSSERRVVRFSRYRVCDIEFVAAFDIDNAKVGVSLADAVGLVDHEADRGNAHSLGMVDLSVQRGPTLDGLDDYQRTKIVEAESSPVDVEAALRAANVDVVICYLPTRSGEAAEQYAQAARSVGAAFITTVPVFVVESGKCTV